MNEGGFCSGQPRPVTDDVVGVDLGLGDTVLCAAACPHRGGRLLYGQVRSDPPRLVCPLHRSVFDLRTGAVVSGPAEESLRVCADTPKGGAAP